MPSLSLIPYEASEERFPSMLYPDADARSQVSTAGGLSRSFEGPHLQPLPMFPNPHTLSTLLEPEQNFGYSI